MSLYLGFPKHAQVAMEVCDYHVPAGVQGRERELVVSQAEVIARDGDVLGRRVAEEAEVLHRAAGREIPPQAGRGVVQQGGLGAAQVQVVAGDRNARAVGQAEGGHQAGARAGRHCWVEGQ